MWFRLLLLLGLLNVRVAITCEKKRSRMLYAGENCKYYFACSYSRSRDNSPRKFPCPQGFVFDFRFQTCVSDYSSFQCQQTETTSCRPKCDCKLCHCHQALCKSTCYHYNRLWCKDRLPRNIPIIPVVKPSFDCSNKMPGSSYSDPRFDCQVYHTCYQKSMASPIAYKTKFCPEGRAFDQIKLSCQPIGSFDCQSVSKWYLIRHSISGKPSVPFRLYSQNPIRPKPAFSFTLVETQGTTTVRSTTFPPPSTTTTLSTITKPPSCPEYQCCPDVCPPCHEICPDGTCDSYLCQKFYSNYSSTLDELSVTPVSIEDFHLEGKPLDPKTSCRAKVHGGMYANASSKCKSFFYCIYDAFLAELIEVSYQCPHGTYFNQKLKQCDWSLPYKCEDSHLYF